MFRFWRTGSKPRPAPISEIAAHFNAAAHDEEHFPSTIDRRIYHVKLIENWLGDLSGKRILDAGCGKGRFARVLRESNSSVRICGLDLAEAMLRFAPLEIDRCVGSLTALPFASGSFDAAYATESLEHAVDIEAAAGELCRIVKPGGRIVIIDKNAEQWGRLHTPRWEKWFDRREMERLLARHCRHVQSQPISYWEDVAPDGLFLAWMAIR